MTPDALAALHARCFTDAPRPWSADAFSGVLAQPGAILIASAAGFALGRAAGGEAELLTLAVAPEARHHGLARALVGGFEAEAHARGAAAVFLETAESNGPARALYTALGYREAGRRPGYYPRRGAPAVAAVVFRKDLFAPHENA